MPKIVPYESQVNFPGPSSGRRAGPSDFGADVGASLENFGITLSKVTIALDEARRATMVNSAVARETAVLQEKQFAISNGYLDKDGMPVSALDPNERHPQWLREVNGTIERVSEQFKGDEGAIKVFRQKMMPIVSNLNLELRKSAIEDQRQAINADLDTALDLQANAAAEADGELRETLITEALIGIQEAQDRGVYSPDEANKRRKLFKTTLATTAVKILIREDPLEALTRLQGNDFPDMPITDRQKWIDIAQKAVELDISRKNAEEDRAFRLSERERAETQRSANKELVDLMSEDKLTPQEVFSRGEALGSLYKAWMDEASGKPITTDTDVYRDLRLRAMDGEDIRKEAASLIGTKLEIQHADKLSAYVESRDSRPAWYKENEKKISMALRLTDSANISIGSGTRGMLALDAFEKWADENIDIMEKDPINGRKRIEDERIAIIRQASIITPEDIGQLGVLSPRFAVVEEGTKYFDLKATYNETEKAYAEGRISKRQYGEENKRIEQWEYIQDMQRQSEDAQTNSTQRRR